jgi:hypothetical protein
MVREKALIFASDVSHSKRSLFRAEPLTDSRIDLCRDRDCANPKAPDEQICSSRMIPTMSYRSEPADNE